MTTLLSASAGPNATSMPANGTTAINKQEYNASIAVPPAVHPKGSEYPPAPLMMTDGHGDSHLSSSSGNNNSGPIALELIVQLNVTSIPGVDAPGPWIICRATAGTTTFYRSQTALHKVLQLASHGEAATEAAASPQTARIVIPEQAQQYVTLYGAHQAALWTLKAKDWHAMEIASPTHTTITLSTSSSTFTFSWTNHLLYQWRLVPNDRTSGSYSLRCYREENKSLVAEFAVEASRFRLWQTTDASLVSFLVISGLLIQDHVESLLKSLGGGMDALQIILDPAFSRFDDDSGSIASSSYYDGSAYYADQGLVDVGTNSRWWTHTTAGGGTSVKSIELDPGALRCWWGYGFWWTWCSCCMPGGWCDRLWIKCRWSFGRKPTMMSQSRQRRQPGWQQQQY